MKKEHFRKNFCRARVAVVAGLSLLALVGALFFPGLLPAGPRVTKAQSTATVSCSVSPSSLGVGNSASLQIQVSGAENLYGYQLKLSFDPALVQIQDADPDKDGVNLELESIDDFVVRNQVQDGVIDLVVTKVSPSSPVQGDAVLARGQLVGLQAGTVNFHFSDLILADGSGDALAVQSTGCSATVQPGGSSGGGGGGSSGGGGGSSGGGSGSAGAGLFADVPADSLLAPYAQAIYQAGITAGCSTNPLSYCPGEPTLRYQMALFLLRGLRGASYTPPAAMGIFADAPVSDPATASIEALYNAGLTSGCSTNPLRFCGGDPVTRGQMAKFLVLAKHGAQFIPPAATGIFPDVGTGRWDAPWIEQLYRDGITVGYTDGTYRPDVTVNRGEMAIFLARAFLGMQ